MMEPIAVNHITITRELFAESQAAVFSKRRQKMLLYCGIAFFAFGAVMLALKSRLPTAAGLGVPALLAGVLVILWSLTIEKSELKKRYKAFLRRNGESSERTVTCYPGYLEVDTGNGEPVKIDYTDVREHRQTEHLLLLLCANHTGVQLAKDGFSEGSQQALLEAIESEKARARQEAEAMRQLEG